MVAKLVALLTDRDRLVLDPRPAGRVRDRLLDHRNVIRAEVTTTASLPAGTRRSHRGQPLAFDRPHHFLTTKVDPAIIGGVVTRIGSTVYDGSVARQLERSG